MNNLGTSRPGPEAFNTSQKEVDTEYFKEIIPQHTSEEKAIKQQRPTGLKQTLNGMNNDLELIFGLRRRKERQSGLTAMQDLQRKKGMDVTNCILMPDGNLLVNLEVCTWCVNRQTCENTESLVSRQIRYAYFTRYPKRKPLKKDALLIKKSIQDGSLVVRSNVTGMINTNPNDVFRPGFGVKKDRNVKLFPLGEVPNTSFEQSWSHVFHSDILGRTLTSFEACLLNFLPSKEATRNLLQLEDHENGFRTLKVLKNIFEEMGVQKGLTKPDFMVKLKQSDLLKSLRENPDLEFVEDVFYHNLLTKTGAYSNSGLYGGKEIFENWGIRGSIENQTEEFLWEVWDRINKLNLQQDDLPFFNPRPPAIIFCGTNQDINHLPFQYQIIRIKYLDGLNQPWVCVDSTINPRKTTQNLRLNNAKIPQQWAMFDENPPIELCKLLKRGHHFNQIHKKVEAQYILKNWEEDSDEGEVNESQKKVVFFPPRDIFSACALSKQLQSVKNSVGNPGNRVQFLRLQSMFELLFFSPNPYVKLSPMIDEEFLNDLKEELNLPGHRRSPAVECIISIAKDPRFSQHISFKEDPNRTDQSRGTKTEQITISTFLIKAESEQDGTHTGQGTKVLFQMTRQAVTRKNEQGTFSKWKEDKASYSKLTKRLHSADARLLIDIMNHGRKKLSNELLSQKYLWISPNIFEQFTREPQKNDAFANLIKSKLNESSLKGVLMIAHISELHYIESLIGRFEYSLHSNNVDGKREYLFWHLTSTVGELSPNFLTIGAFDEY
jgi:hypothetical protein